MQLLGVSFTLTISPEYPALLFLYRHSRVKGSAGSFSSTGGALLLVCVPGKINLKILNMWTMAKSTIDDRREFDSKTVKFEKSFRKEQFSNCKRGWIRGWNLALWCSAPGVVIRTLKSGAFPLLLSALILAVSFLLSALNSYFTEWNSRASRSFFRF